MSLWKSCPQLTVHHNDPDSVLGVLVPHVGAGVVAAVVDDGALDGQHRGDVARGGPQHRLYSGREEVFDS